MKHQFLALAVAALSFTACTNEDNITQDFLADTPIKLNVSVDEPTTRAGYSNAELPEGFGLTVDHYLDPDHDDRDKKYSYQVWVKKVEDSWKTYKLNELDDGTWGVTDEEVTMLWANMKDEVDVTAFTKDENITITIPTDQTSDEQLKQADVLYMPSTWYTPNERSINVKLQHAMSKINLTIELGSEYEFTQEDVDKKITDVKIDGSKVKANYGINSSTDDPQVSFSNYSGDPTPIFPFHTGTTPYSKTGGVITKASATYEAILIPQYIESGKFAVSFKVNGKLYEWTYNKELTLDPTIAYTLKLIAGNDKVQPVSFSVAEWGKGNGDGENKETD